MKFLRNICLSLDNDDLFSLKQTLTDENRPVIPRKKISPRNRTSSATESNQPVSTFESLSVNTQLTTDKASRDTSPNLRTRRFSGDDIILPLSSSSEIVEPSLFSPGSVRARTISSIQENKNLSSLPKRQNSLSTPPVEPPTPPSPSKRLDIRLSSGKTINSSDFIHSEHQKQPLPTDHLINPHVEISHNQQQPNQIANETARNKLLQSVYVNNTNPNPSSLSESLTNGTNSHSHATESSSNCVLS